MSFMEGILEQNMPVWDKCIATMFVQDMKDGKLTIEDFKEYMVQDKKCGSLSEADQKKLGSIFEKASYPELDFWNIEVGGKRHEG